jgi:hypothetical protein
MSTEWQQYFDNESPPPAGRYAVISHTTRYENYNMESINFFYLANNGWQSMREAFQVNTPNTQGHERFAKGPESKNEFLGFIKSRHYPELVDIAERVQAVEGLHFRDFTNNVFRKALKRDMPEWPWKMEPPNVRDSILDGKTIRTKAHGKRWESRLTAEVDRFFKEEEHNWDFNIIGSRYNFWRRYASRVADSLREKGSGLSAMQRYAKIPHGYDDISYVSSSRAPKSGSKHNRSPHQSRTFLSGHSGHSGQSYISDNSEVISNGSFHPASSDKGSNVSSSSRSRVSSHNSIIRANSDKGSRLSRHSLSSSRAPSSVSSGASSRRSSIFSSNGGGSGLSSLVSSVSSARSYHSRNSADVLPSDSASIQGSERGIKHTEREVEAAKQNAKLDGKKQAAYLFDKYLQETNGGSEVVAHKRARRHSTGAHESRRGRRRHRGETASQASQSEASGVSLVSYVTDTNNPLRVSRKVPRREARKSYNWGRYIVPPV